MNNEGKNETKPAWRKAFECLTSFKIGTMDGNVHMLTIHEAIEDLKEYENTEGMTLAEIAFRWVGISSGGTEIYCDGEVQYCGIVS